MTNFTQELRKWQPRSSAIRAHLRRWADDERAEEVWKAVSKAAGISLTANEFVRFVAHAAMESRALPVRLEDHKHEIAATKAAIGSHLLDALASNRPVPEIADILEEGAWQLRFREKFSMLDGYPQGARSRRKSSQSRRALSLTLSDFFKERCGKWMDNEVGVLLEIAFGPSGDDTSQEARDYRRSRANKVGV
ncbi:hypothetical protein JQ621_03155 [Bradyrhizobium manausense]|uniref:hypothetical protein n=1 Tax=Bradyrhizobium manausense TaxID=989370 RepID=UPI001BAB70CE|nr:hypothetical protein [Bradyrhizobium manausense]MBR1086466.1 hypothetical protein [Bradyrhizobium manausense]